MERNRVTDTPAETTTVMNYQTGEHIRAATATDLSAAASCDRHTGAFACPVTGRGVYLDGIGFDGERYEFATITDELVDADGDCRECGHPAEGSSGWGGCDSAAHRG